MRLTFRIKALFLLIAAAPLITNAQDPFRGWQWQNPLPQGNSINSIRFAPDKKRGWAVGANGVVLTTNNGGFEWEEQTHVRLTQLCTACTSRIVRAL